MTLLDLLTGPWAIAPDKLLELQMIYATHMRGDKIDVAALESRLGRPLSNEQQQYSIERGGVAVLRLAGVMAPKANLFMEISGGISTQKAAVQLESASIDPRVVATILHMDTPGGNVIGTPEFGETIFQLSQRKPIITYSDGQLCSAGYWSGAAANAVYISGPVVQVGSIGVVHSRSYNPNSPVVEENITAGRYKRLVTSKEPYSAESRAIVQADVDYVYSLFVDTVATYRGTTSKQVLENMADGRVFRGQQAIDAGLVDGVSTLDELIDKLAENPAAFANRRKAVFALGADSKSLAAGVPEDTTTSETKEPVMPDATKPSLTRASFEQDHAPLFAQISAEFLALGATQERTRIQAVLAVGDGLPGHEKVLSTLAYDGKTTAAEASVVVLVAEKGARAAALKAHADDAPPPAKPSAAPTDKGAKTKAQQVSEAQAYAKEKGTDFVSALKELGYAS